MRISTWAGGGERRTAVRAGFGITTVGLVVSDGVVRVLVMVPLPAGIAAVGRDTEDTVSEGVLPAKAIITVIKKLL